jgi:hypothetical protein
MPPETGHFLGEGGIVYEMDLPLPEVMADKLTKGYLRRVNPDGSQYQEPTAGDPATDPTARPAVNAPKAEWVGWAVRVHGMSPDDADAKTKTDLAQLPDKPDHQ